MIIAGKFGVQAYGTSSVLGVHIYGVVCLQRQSIKVEVKSVCKQMVCLHLNCCIFLKYDVLSEYLTPFWFAML